MCIGTLVDLLFDGVLTDVGSLETWVAVSMQCLLTGTGMRTKHSCGINGTKALPVHRTLGIWGLCRQGAVWVLIGGCVQMYFRQACRITNAGHAWRHTMPTLRRAANDMLTSKHRGS